MENFTKKELKMIEEALVYDIEENMEDEEDRKNKQELLKKVRETFI